MLPEVIGAEIANRVFAATQSLGMESTHYPAPGELPVFPTMVLFWQDVDVAESNEQILIMTFRGDLFTALEVVEEQISEVDPFVVPIIDAFSANLNRANYHLQRPDGDRVEQCYVTRAELSIPISYNGKQHYGGRVFWRVKVRRFAGST